MTWLGDYPTSFATVTCMFTTHASAGAPVAPSTAFENADVRIYKNGSATERTSQNGVTMTSPFDTITGLHCLTIDLSDNSDAGFYAAGSVYTLVLAPDTETVDGVAVAKVIGQFGIALAPVFARLGAPAGASIAADIAAVKTDTAAVKTKTDFLPSATAGAAGGVFIAGTNAATAVTTSFTTTFTGNLTGSVGSVTGAVGSVAGLTASDVGTILADTNELQTDWANGGRLDNILDARASQTSVDDLPTNAELATALGTADDAVLSAVGALSIPTANQNADALLDRANAIETGLTPRQAMRLSAAADGGKLSGGATTTNTIRNAVADSKDRIVATVDVDGNRTAITYDLT